MATTEDIRRVKDIVVTVNGVEERMEIEAINIIDTSDPDHVTVTAQDWVRVSITGLGTFEGSYAGIVGGVRMIGNVAPPPPPAPPAPELPVGEEPGS